MDRDRIIAGVKLVLEGIGEDINREGLKGTPERVADMYCEIFSGLEQDPAEIIAVTFGEDHDEIVLVKNIPLYSICEHHLIPFIGQAHVAYLPNENGRITGISKLARIVDVFAKRPQVQERMTSRIADTLERHLEPRGVFVIIEAEHLCMSMRGVQKPGSKTVTSAVRGIFRSNDASRAEVLSLIGNLNYG